MRSVPGRDRPSQRPQLRLDRTRADQDVRVAAPEPVDQQQRGRLSGDGQQQFLGARRHDYPVPEHPRVW